MSNNRITILVSMLFLTVGLFSCKEKEYGGEDMINYPDLAKLFEREVDTESPINYLHIRQEGSQKDSSDLPYNQVPWDEIQSLFVDGNLQKKELNKKYAISILNDTLTNTRTLYYEALDPDIPTRSLSITSNVNDNEIQNIYFDFVEKGMMKSRNSRVLLIPEQLIQVQNRAKEKTVVDSYYYPQP